MIKTILLCCDGSTYSDTARHAAVWLGKALHARIRALSVVDSRMLEGPWLADLSGILGAQPFQSLLPQMRELYGKKAASITEDAASAARRENVPCDPEVRTGLLVEEILQAERDAEMVVIGQRGEGHEHTGEWLGSNVERVVRKSIKPCLVTSGEFRPIRTILAAYDGSEHANHALYVALELARSLKATLMLLTVEGSDDEEEKSWALKEAVEIASKQGVQASPIALHGSPEEKILEIAASKKCDLIVLGAYGHSRLRELVLGSVTSHVIRKSPVPVLLTR